jgi:antitoxin (DNA-binding transcriptional repressor) of toxin-antitoxin stability system
VDRTGQIYIGTEPVGWVAGQAGRSHHRHAGLHVVQKISPQQLEIELITGPLSAGMGVHVDQAGNQPAFGDQLGVADGVGRPPIAVGIQINGFAVGKREAPNAQHGHRAMLAPDSSQCSTLKNMAEVGIRTLKQKASAVVAQAAAGETVTITDRGRPVAQMTAIPSSRLRRLVDSGGARLPRRSIKDLPAPKRGPKLTDELAALRDAERY